MDVHNIIDHLTQLVSDSGTPGPEARVVASSLLAQLKVAHRVSNQATRLAKDNAAASRHEMDQSHLRLQNLLYEKRHLEREIEKCRQFGSIYQDVPLHPLDQFVQLSPSNAHTPDIMANEHELMKNRLNFELEERMRLNEQKKIILKIKEDLLKESKGKQQMTDSVKTQIDKLIQTAVDTQKTVNGLTAELDTADPQLESNPGPAPPLTES
ncbi:hypothetical protein CYLTODRAFT_450755 [Cylindrobasidium torrendii FP15055 ss-10]|uniref:Fms interacting protein n=1 Tax=Cylindrobasidium torrendii FP15055 ss-10 TaxID=1314674 RepID=A0A0D7BLT7_9AGAR|nr:hypothetical protein CYLTODRAFT_450755 [Cylindrobasidium torrendii FP15055 ss-10]